MSDANLDRRRAEVAREQAESAQRALGQYFVAAEAQRVNTSELEALEAELGTVRAQLAAAEAARTTPSPSRLPRSSSPRATTRPTST